jgi:protein gp37
VKLTGGGPRWTGQSRVVRDHLRDPLHWKKPCRIFTDSMSDLFYEGFSDGDIDEVVAVMMICALRDRGNHVFQTLTKRPQRMRAYFDNPDTQRRVAAVAGSMMEDGDSWYDEIALREDGLSHPNLWWGTSIENQDAVVDRMVDLLATKAAVRFVSCEPLLGPVTLGLLGTLPADITGGAYVMSYERLHWVIAGCESGPGARPCDVNWLRMLRDECHATVPFFLKQAESAAIFVAGPGNGYCGVSIAAGSKRKGKNVVELPYLDGFQHKEFPCSI